MRSIREAVRGRRSVRTFDGKGLTAEERGKIEALCREAGSPYDVQIEYRILDAGEHELKSPVISGTDVYIAAKMKREEHFEEALGFSFEKIVLEAQEMGIGTTWIGGTMDRPAFERAMELREDEVMPCISPLGHPAKRMSLKETLMRKGVGADRRKPFGELFFDGAFGKPLTEEKAGALAFPLEMVRLAPSAVNKQPWRIVTEEGRAHFYMLQSKGFSAAASGNMQKIDMGIALCHFFFAAKEAGLEPEFTREDPGMEIPDDVTYIATYRF